MEKDWDIFGLHYQNNNDSSTVLGEYIKHLANKKLQVYKSIIQTGSKAGESLWTHIMNLVTTVEKLRPVFELSPDEMRCLLLALTVHDINKVDEYGKRPDGKHAGYAEAAHIDNLAKELRELEAEIFFPEWETYLYDIKYLVDAHQVAKTLWSQINQKPLTQCRLEQKRLEGPLRSLMRVADVSDNSHSGHYADRHEKHIRDKLIIHLDAALNSGGYPRRYRFIGHRLAELRGLLTNVIHNEIVAYLHETYGEDSCIDLLYHPSGVDYLLDRRYQLQWTPETLRLLAARIEQKFARLQFQQLEEFIKARPFGISVDEAAMESGASVADIFRYISGIVAQKRYRQEWWEQRDTFVRNDLEAALNEAKEATPLQERITLLLRERQLMPSAEDALKRGELVMAYRNFLSAHRSELLKIIKQDAWTRVYRLFELPMEQEALYQLIDPYRRAYFLARDLAPYSPEQMEQMILADLDRLEQEAAGAQAQKKKKSPSRTNETDTPQAETASTSSGSYLVDYLERNLEFWDSAAASAPRQPVNFLDSLRQYVDDKRPDAQCCHCASPLKASEWMALQVPRSIGVQNFSNRLEGGSSREPKRNVCDVCRTQFILEKLAWRTHKDKQGGELVTFYIHLFPYSFYTQPMLDAWWQSLNRLRTEDHTAVFLDTRDYFLEQGDGRPSFEKQIRVFYKGLEGIGLASFSETISNTPVLPLIAGGKNSSIKFLLALEKAVLLAHWFGSRVLLSRLPTPLLDLSAEQIDEQPVALGIENVPSAMSWLVRENMLTIEQLKFLHQRLYLLYQIARVVAAGDELAYRETIYELVSAAANDPLSMYHVADRLIEQQVARKKNARPDLKAIELGGAIAGLLKQLLEEKNNA